MKSELGKRLQEIVDQRGIISPDKVVIWIEQEHPETGAKTIIGYGGKSVVDTVKRKAQQRRSRRGKAR